jgi:hypothetical protein
MSWLLDIFSDKASRIGLATAILTSIVTLLVVFVAHRLTHLRSRKELKAQKLEELYVALRVFRVLGMEQIGLKPEDRSARNNGFKEYRDAFESIEMLALLYLPSASELIDKMNMAVDAAIEGRDFPYKSHGYDMLDNYSGFFLKHASHFRNELHEQAKKVA